MYITVVVLINIFFGSLIDVLYIFVILRSVQNISLFGINKMAKISFSYDN